MPDVRKMLATGYGIEKVEYEELDVIRRELNDSYTGFEAAFNALKPLLALLPDGYYVVGDVECAPIDGNTFFYNVSNGMTYNESCCGILYDSEFCFDVDPFPTYLYPTQSVESINEEQVKTYIEKIERGDEIRGLAYYEDGFLCALLDGHHKAIAAGKLGRKIKCLTIIQADYVILKDKCMTFDDNGLVERIGFCGLEVDPGTALKQGDVFKRSSFEVQFDTIPKEIEHYNLTDDRYKSLDYCVENDYVYIDMMSPFMMIKEDNQDYSEDTINKLIENPSYENGLILEWLIRYRREQDPESAYKISEKIVCKDAIYLPYREAWKTLIKRKNEHVENMVIEYLVNNTPNDSCWDIVNSYWD